MRSTTAAPRGEKTPGATRKQYVRVKCEPDVAARLKALASANRRSMGLQIDWLLWEEEQRRLSPSPAPGQ